MPYCITLVNPKFAFGTLNNKSIGNKFKKFSGFALLDKFSALTLEDLHFINCLHISNRFYVRRSIYNRSLISQVDLIEFNEDLIVN